MFASSDDLTRHHRSACSLALGRLGGVRHGLVLMILLAPCCTLELSAPPRCSVTVGLLHATPGPAGRPGEAWMRSVRPERVRGGSVSALSPKRNLAI